MPRIDITGLSAQERLELIAQLWDSLDVDQITPTPVQLAELDRRRATADADLADSVSWEAFRAEVTSHRA